MAKKKKLTPAEDLIDSLLEDIHPTEEESDGKETVFVMPDEPEGMEQKFSGPTAKEEKYEGPSAGEGGFQSPDDVFAEASITRPVDKTIPLPLPGQKSTPEVDLNTIKKSSHDLSDPHIDKLVVNPVKLMSNVMTHMDASLVQADSLKYAQQRILDLEVELDKLRSDFDELANASEIIKSKSDEWVLKLSHLEKERIEVEENKNKEISILRNSIQHKDKEIETINLKVSELELRLKNDFKKVRVRERELENRLELAKTEKSALMRAKDDQILELKRKMDQLYSELDNYRDKCLELNKTIEANQEQFKRTVRALKLALNNLEVKDEDVIPLKKAE